MWKFYSRERERRIERERGETKEILVQKIVQGKISALRRHQFFSWISDFREKNALLSKPISLVISRTIELWP